MNKNVFLKNKKTKRNIGNFLILLSIFLVGFIYYPILKVYFFPVKIIEVSQTKQFTIQIPKIGVISKITENVNPFNQDEYQKALKFGVAQAKGTYLPGQKKTIFIFGHSSQAPWEVTRVNVSFLKLGELEAGDEIIIKRNGKEYRYKVFDKKIVWPSETQYLKNTKEDKLILQTCTPIGTSLQRLLVFARPI